MRSVGSHRPGAVGCGESHGSRRRRFALAQLTGEKIRMSVSSYRGHDVLLKRYALQLLGRGRTSLQALADYRTGNNTRGSGTAHTL